MTQQTSLMAVGLTWVFLAWLSGAQTARSEDVMLKEIHADAPQSLIFELKTTEDVIKTSPPLFGAGGVFADTKVDASVALANAYQFLHHPADIRLLSVAGVLYPCQVAPGAETIFDSEKPGDYDWTFMDARMRAIDFGHKVFGERKHLVKPSGRVFWELRFYGMPKQGIGRWLTLFSLQDGAIILPTLRNATAAEISELKEMGPRILGDLLKE